MTDKIFFSKEDIMYHVQFWTPYFKICTQAEKAIKTIKNKKD